MNAERWQQVKIVLEGALETAPAARRAFLENRCGGDELLRGEVEKLLAFETPVADPLEEPAFAAVTAEKDAAKLIGREIGRYRILREIGAGGMGAVYLAERADGEFEQKVALKLIKPGLISDALLRRFVNERQILASLDHPNIAHLIDGGTTADRLPFLVMEYVEGDTIIEFARQANLTLEEKLDLFREVCAAAAFAHQNLIIHRDLKPSNILVNADGKPKLLDFGIAKLLTKTAAQQTSTQHFALTPDYASPEQMRGENLTTATDIYSLGVILFELLTGTRPFAFDNKNFAEIIQTLTQTAPPAPSAIHHSKRKNRLLNENPKSKIQNPKSLSGDLDNIVLKALSKEPERRYATVEQFSEDVRRHLKGLPVTARSDTFFYRAGKFVSRNPLIVGTLALAFVILLGGIVAVAWQARIADAERVKAERRFNDVRTLANSFIFEVNGKIEESPIKARELLVTRAVEYLDKLAAEADADETLQAELAAAYEKIGDVQAEYFSSGIGDTAGALENQRKSLQIRHKLAATAPENLQYQLDTTNSYLKIADLSVTIGAMPSALENYRQAVALVEDADRRQPSDTEIRRLLARAYAKFGQGVLRSGSISRALENFEKADALMRQLAAENPSNVKFRRYLSVFKQYAAYAKMEMGEENASLELYAEAGGIEREILKNDPANEENQRASAVVQLWTGINLRRLRRFEESLSDQRKALQTQQKFYDADESNIGDVNALADSHLEIGWTLTEFGDTANAAAHLEKAVALYETVARIDTKNASAQRQIEFTRLRLGEALEKSGDRKAAARIYEKALLEAETLNRTDSQNSEYRHDKAVCLLRLAALEMHDQAAAPPKLNEAIALLQTLAAESPEHRQRQNDLRRALNLRAQLH